LLDLTRTVRDCDPSWAGFYVAKVAVVVGSAEAGADFGSATFSHYMSVKMVEAKQTQTLNVDWRQLTFNAFHGRGLGWSYPVAARRRNCPRRSPTLRPSLAVPVD
jgi:hypothetical protein